MSEHGRVEDDEGGADYTRLIDEITGIVALVERRAPDQRRALFDAYVTAVTEFGASAAELASIEPAIAEADGDDDLDDDAYDDLLDDDSADEAVAEPVRPLAKARVEPRGARTSASQGKSGYDVPGGAGAVGDAHGDEAATGADDAAPRIRRRGTSG